MKQSSFALLGIEIAPDIVDFGESGVQGTVRSEQMGQNVTWSVHKGGQFLDIKVTDSGGLRLPARFHDDGLGIVFQFGPVNGDSIE